MEPLIFGPVPSRRLGRSLGVNNIPHKVCSYSCTYCQVGKAVQMGILRREFYSPAVIVEQVDERLKGLAKVDYPDYITIVPDGEPTLDIHLGQLIQALKRFGIPVAVITNSSLLPLEEVQDELMMADFLSMKIDSVQEALWRKIDKPHRGLRFDQILRAAEVFSTKFKGTLVTETMLIKGINDHEAALSANAQFLKLLNPSIAYLAIPTRPPAFKNTLPPDEAGVVQAYQVYTKEGIKTELLTGYEGNAFTSSGSFSEDMLSITAVHPMREDAVRALMERSQATDDDLNSLILQQLITCVVYNQATYYLRKFHNQKST